MKTIKKKTVKVNIWKGTEFYMYNVGQGLECWTQRSAMF